MTLPGLAASLLAPPANSMPSFANSVHDPAAVAAMLGTSLQSNSLPFVPMTPFVTPPPPTSDSRQVSMQMPPIRRSSSTSTNPAVNTCKMCKREFATLELLAVHDCNQRASVSAKITKFMLSCDECAKRFSGNPRVLWFRNATLTPNELATFSCTICGASLQQDMLRAPSRTEEQLLAREPASNSFDCKICGVSFARGDRLLAHSRVHTGEKPFPCDLCSRSFSRKDRLKAHRETHMGTARHRCTICMRPFTQSYHLTKHMKVSFRM
jgi:uncharacterized Zn-finger protein